MGELAAVVFDFDGVIADTEPLHFAGFGRSRYQLERVRLLCELSRL